MGRILILGSSGQVGSELRRSFADLGELVCPDRNTLDLTDAEQLRAAIRRINPDLILNAAAYTAVDRAESEPELAMAINAHAPRVLAEEAARQNILLVHYSTDYVFDGTKRTPWIETDPTNPLNVYGASKLAGERAIQEIGGKFLIFRTSWVYGPHGHNFLLTMLRIGRERDELRVVDDQIGAPTTSMELANSTQHIVQGIPAGIYGSPAQWAGIYHATCGGSTSWFGFAQEILQRGNDLLNGPAARVLPISSSQYPTAARRPHNSILNTEKLQRQLGVQFGTWQAALDGVLSIMRSGIVTHRIDPGKVDANSPAQME